MHLFYYQTEIGKLGIAEEDGKITNIYFANDTIPHTAIIMESDTLKTAYSQLYCYFAGKLREFTLPLAPHGTEFQRNIWRLLCEIPYANTSSYQDIAIAAGNAKAVRAVGMANHHNPIPIFIPCHRVIGKNGHLVGYRGGLTVKRTLLALEAGAQDGL